MRYLILLFYFISLSVFAGESNKSSHDHHDHSSHDHKGDQTFVDGQKLKSIDLVAVKTVDSKGMLSSAFEAIGFYIYSFFMQDEVN